MLFRPSYERPLPPPEPQLHPANQFPGATRARPSPRPAERSAQWENIRARNSPCRGLDGCHSRREFVPERVTKSPLSRLVAAGPSWLQHQRGAQVPPPFSFQEATGQQAAWRGSAPAWAPPPPGLRGTRAHPPARGAGICILETA